MDSVKILFCTTCHSMIARKEDVEKRVITYHCDNCGKDDEVGGKGECNGIIHVTRINIKDVQDES